MILFNRQIAAVTWLVAVAAGSAAAQVTPPAPNIHELMGRKVTLWANDMALDAAFRALCEQAKAQYAVAAPSGRTVSLSVADVPLRTALAALVRTSDYGYFIENGVITLIRPYDSFGSPRMGTGIPYPPPGTPLQVQINFADARETAARLCSIPGFRPEDGVNLVCNPALNTLLLYTETIDQFRNLREAIRLLDAQPQQVKVRVDLVAAESGPDRDEAPLVTTATARCENGKRVRLSLNFTGRRSPGRPTLLGGESRLTLTCRVNGDNSVAVEADWSADLKRLNRTGRVERCRQAYRGSTVIDDGETRAIAATMALPGRNAGPVIRLFVSPRVIRNERTYPWAPETRETDTVFLLDFTERTPVTGGRLSGVAKEAVMNEMGRSGRAEVLKPDEVDRVAEDLGIKPPFAPIERRRIADKLGTNGYVTGEVRSVIRQSDSKSEAVTARVRVEVHDAFDGALMSREDGVAVQRASSGSRTVRSLTENAVYEASVRAARQQVHHRKHAATVLDVRHEPKGRTFLEVNRGSQDGYRPGMNLAIYTYAQQIGAAQITKVGPFSSEAVVLEGALAVRPTDVVRPVPSP